MKVEMLRDHLPSLTYEDGACEDEADLNTGREHSTLHQACIQALNARRLSAKADVRIGRACEMEESNENELMNLSLLHTDMSGLLRTPPLVFGWKPSCSDSPQYGEELELYLKFTFALQSGMMLTRLTPTLDYAEIHCRVMDDMTRIMFHDGTGYTADFPFIAVSSLKRYARLDGNWYSMDHKSSVNMPSHAEHMVAVQFRGLELVFIFSSADIAKVFSECLEMLIRRAHKKMEDHPKAKSAPVPGDAIPPDKLSLLEPTSTPFFAPPTYHF